jgi:Sugar (and other) transporter
VSSTVDRRNALDALDQNTPTRFYWSLTLLATLGGFPTAVRGQAASIAATVDWLANYALIEAFPASQRAIGLGWVLICFAGLCVLAIGFVGRYLPETKGLSVEQITKVFEEQAAGEPVR